MKTSLTGRKSSVNTDSTKIKPILDYILDHSEGDERPYLKVKIFGTEVLGLLDSGASRTIIGLNGWKRIKDLGITIDQSSRINCKVANGQLCESTGTCLIPFTVRDRTKIIPTLLIPDVKHPLILGADFWRAMGIVPDLRHDEWHFTEPDALLFTVEHLNQQSRLTDLQKARLNSVIERNREMMKSELGCTDVAEHVIKCTAEPIKQRYYPVSPVIQKQINEELDDMLRLDVVERSQSPWSSPVLLVKKKDGKYRFCVDYRKLNAVTERDSYPLPYIEHTLNKLRNAHYLSTLDIKSAYWNIPVAKSSRPFTAFTVPGRGLFQFKRMPFGLHNAPATWQRLIDKVLGDDLEPYCFSYLDDICLVTKTFEQHISIMEEVLKRLREAKLSIRWDKCQFCRPELKYLGHVVDRLGLHVDPDKVRAMLELPTPKTAKEVRQVLGTFSWYRKFIPNFSKLISPLTALTRKGRKFVWTDECESAFTEIKNCLVAAPVLTCPDYNLPFVVQCDASGYGLGAVLTQTCEDGDKVISYLSRSLTKGERNYSVTERECLAVLWAIEKLRPYLEGVPFTVITDHHSLVWLQNLKDPTGRLARWAVKLQQYDFRIIHRKGKDHVVPDTLSRSVPVVDTITAEDTFLDQQDSWYSKMLKIVEEHPLKYPQWRVTGGTLYKYEKPKIVELGDPSDNWKAVVPKRCRRQVVEDAHNPPTSGHLGVAKTYHRVSQRYYWPKMKHFVSRFVRSCRECAMHKPYLDKPIGQMTSQTIPTRPWEIISCDLMGPFPRSSKGHKFIFVVTDNFSKYSLVFPLRSSTADMVCRKLEEDIFLVYGVPRLLLCDNGPQFISNRLRHLVSEYKVKIRYNAYYHPQANPTERVNRNIKTMLAIYVEENQRTWDKQLAKISCALRSAVHDTTNHTPYYVNFGRNMVLSGDEYFRKDDFGDTSVPNDVRATGFKKLFEEVRERIRKSSDRNRKYYNLRRRPVELNVGQKVWKKNFPQSDATKNFSAKLAPKYIGPFIIYKKLSPWTYELRKEDGSPQGIWNAKDLKPASADENLPG